MVTPPTIGHAAELEVGDVVTLNIGTFTLTEHRDTGMCRTGFWRAREMSPEYVVGIFHDLGNALSVTRDGRTIYEAGGEGA